MQEIADVNLCWVNFDFRTGQLYQKLNKRMSLALARYAANSRAVKPLNGVLKPRGKVLCSRRRRDTRFKIAAVKGVGTTPTIANSKLLISPVEFHKA